MAYPDQPASPRMTSPRSMAAEQDIEVKDDSGLVWASCFSDSSYLNVCDSKKKNSTEASAILEGRSKFSLQYKKNFVLEQDVRYLDSRIALDEVSSIWLF